MIYELSDHLFSKVVLFFCKARSLKSMKQMFSLLTAGIMAAGLCSCASIVSQSDQTVSISTEPDNAWVIIKNSKGKIVHRAKSPTNVTLRKADGYFGGETYAVSIRKDGYFAKDMIIDSTPSGWYLFGNLAFGGLIGWFIIDPATGAMYKLEPETIETELTVSR